MNAETRLEKRLGFSVNEDGIINPLQPHLRNAILTLWNELLRLERENEWIPVSERLPKVGETVLALKPSCWDAPIHIITYSTEAEKHRTLVRTDGQWWHHGTQVTHWRPLPQPPEREK